MSGLSSSIIYTANSAGPLRKALSKRVLMLIMDGASAVASSLLPSRLNVRLHLVTVLEDEVDLAHTLVCKHENSNRIRSLDCSMLVDRCIQDINGFAGHSYLHL